LRWAAPIEEDLIGWALISLPPRILC